MIFKWREIYRTYSQKEQIYFCEKLKQYNIPFKIKTHSLRSRMANTVLLRGSPMAANSSKLRIDAIIDDFAISRYSEEGIKILYHLIKLRDDIGTSTLFTCQCSPDEWREGVLRQA